MMDDTSAPTGLSPEDAFAVLGDETRLEILRALGDAGEPLSFSELFERVDCETSANFSYHLDKLAGHFVRKTDHGYALRQAGNRIIEAILSGTVTDAPVIEATEIDTPCPFCETPIVVSFREERVEMFCPGCAGTYGRVGETQNRDIPADYGYLGAVNFPPAGTEDRSAVEMIRAALTWGNLEFFAASRGVCPRCSARFEESITVCETHDLTNGLCVDCGKRHAVQIRYQCPTCPFDESGGFWNALWGETEFLSFLSDHGINPVSPPPDSYARIVASYEEEVLSVEPFKARFTYTIDGESLTLTVDETLEVVEVTRDDAPESG